MSDDITMSVREVLARIYAERGVLTPEDVVEEARPEDSPLHDHFEWNNDVAAHSHRLEQARGLIRRVKVTVVTSPTEPPKRIRLYHAMTPTGGDDKKPSARVYRSLDDVRADPDAMERILAQMEREFRTLRNRWLAHREVFGSVVLRVIDEDGTDPSTKAS